MKLNRITPSKLKGRKKEAYNFQKASGILADYGFQTIKLSDDWCGADFIAQHIDGEFIKVQLKSRIAVGEKYRNQNLWICFPSKDDWYLVPHDELLTCLKKKKKSIENTQSWKNGGYSIGYVTAELTIALEKYKIKDA